jgi:16S rRNA (adenine1518-N6/adenine1519-N6)-dimethyltransferase
LDFYPGAYGLKPASYKIVANIPYNITGAILKKFLTEKEHPSEMVLMVQLEVARRIMARDGKESLLSLSVKAYGVPKMIMKVEARYFSPVPKVDSAVLRIKDISKADFLKNKDREKEFWHLIHKSFSHKRKKLGSNLKNTNWTKKGRFLSLKDKRAEDLSLKDWQDLLK